MLFCDMAGDFFVGLLREEFVRKGIHLALKKPHLVAKGIVQINLIATIEKEIPQNGHAQCPLWSGVE